MLSLQAIKASARELRAAERIPWDDLKSITEAYKKANPGRPVYLSQLCGPSDIVLQAPPAKGKSPELQARLNRLQEELENRRYSEMVADITEGERRAEELRGSVLPSARLQLSFGAHVLVTMFTFWAVAFYGTKFYLGYDDRWAGLSGALGLTAGLLLETTLLIIRTNRPVPLEERMPELFDSAKVAEAYAKVRELKAADKESRRKARPGPGAAGGGGGGSGNGSGRPGGKGAGSGAATAESKKSR
ncbi:hypothetical protein GPECTOR_38g259 [Gonium pectorale]|uniref:Uncharacterized protein n=1 Tax=Gonium pectorale TaxID=33097 RepID=A0A150GB06_GONPE|nr:hypothetical protein GPECTOR_38g259 [Gonium pectorale]|eukprot:KXZ47022.1 hypothetical protein GPECTOR_38g259 [Gonium pectorale]